MPKTSFPQMIGPAFIAFNNRKGTDTYRHSEAQRSLQFRMSIGIAAKEKLFMRSTKKSALGLTPTLLVVLTVVLSACGSAGTSTNVITRAPANQQVFNRPLTGIADIKTFDPAM